MPNGINNLKKKQLLLYCFVLILLLTGMAPLRAQYKAKLSNGNNICYRASKVYIGVKVSVGSGFLSYPALEDERQLLNISEDAGAYLEWRFFDKFSAGLDVLYTSRGYRLAFNTPYLLNYTQTAITNITYNMRVQGVEVSVPLTYYFGKPKEWLDSYTRSFVFAGPVFFLPLNGKIMWKRTHLIDNQVIASYEYPLNSSNFSPYDYGVKAGLGFVFKQRVGHYFYTARADMSFYYGLSDTFSESELKHAALFHGLGDIEHEILGTRYLRQLKISFSFAIPFRDKPKGACRDFGIY